MNRYRQIINQRSRSEWENLIHEWVHSDLERALLTRRLLDDAKLDELVDEFQPLQMYCIRERLGAAQKQLFSHIN